jgi:hypothetical protein
MSANSSKRRADAVLVAVAIALGLAGAAAYAAWRAISREGLDSGARWSEFSDAMVFPGAVIVVAIAAMVWLGWKANID